LFLQANARGTPANASRSLRAEPPKSDRPSLTPHKRSLWTVLEAVSGRPANSAAEQPRKLVFVGIERPPPVGPGRPAIQQVHRRPVLGPGTFLRPLPAVPTRPVEIGIAFLRRAPRLRPGESAKPPGNQAPRPTPQNDPPQECISCLTLSKRRPTFEMGSSRFLEAKGIANHLRRDLRPARP